MPTDKIVIFPFLAALMLCFPLSAHSEYFVSYAQCKQAYEAARRDTDYWDKESSGCLSGRTPVCRGLKGNDLFNKGFYPLQRRYQEASKKQFEIGRTCDELQRNEQAALSQQRQQLQQQEQQAAQARDQYNRDRANEQRVHAQQQQAAYTARQAKAQAIGSLLGGLLGLLNSNDSSSARSDSSAQTRRDQDIARQRAEQEGRRAAANEARQRAEAEQRAQKEKDQSVYDRLVGELNAYKDAKARLSTATEYVTNPFAASARIASDSISSGVVGATVDGAFPVREGSDSRYELMASVVDSARTRALSGNPFAESVSGVSMGGVHTVHRRALGELDRAGNDPQNFGNNSAPAWSRTGTAYYAAPSRATGGGPSGSSYTYPSPGQFNAPAMRYYDPDTRTTLEVPSGHVLYRSPGATQMVVVNYAQITEPPASGDRPWLGAKGCGTGQGIVTPECEKIRRNRANPFGAAK